MRDEDEILPPTMSDPKVSHFRFKCRYRTQKRKRGTEFIYELRDVPDEHLELNPLARSTNVVENTVASREEIPQKNYEQIPEQDVKETDLESEQIPEQDVQETDLESGGATIECAKEINDHLSLPDESVSIGGSLAKEIIGQ